MNTISRTDSQKEWTPSLKGSESTTRVQQQCHMNTISRTEGKNTHRFGCDTHMGPVNCNTISTTIGHNTSSESTTCSPLPHCDTNRGLINCTTTGTAVVHNTVQKAQGGSGSPLPHRTDSQRSAVTRTQHHSQRTSQLPQKEHVKRPQNTSGSESTTHARRPKERTFTEVGTHGCHIGPVNCNTISTSIVHNTDSENTTQQQCIVTQN
eukprot:m.157360 g.157360  ORF g.157360 m.157360 type:complete len:208 (-) comp14463_c1_seq1:591-1214(-)